MVCFTGTVPSICLGDVGFKAKETLKYDMRTGFGDQPPMDLHRDFNSVVSVFEDGGTRRGILLSRFYCYFSVFDPAVQYITFVCLI